MIFRFVLLCLIISTHQASCYHVGGCWSPYINASIPDDAFVAGQNRNGNVYVGQAFTTMVNGGMVPAQINDGVQEIEVPFAGGFKTDQHINILCGPKANFKWLLTDSTHLSQDLLGKQPVLGGFAALNGDYYIARVSILGETFVGALPLFEKIPYIYFVFNHQTITSDRYEVLYYEES